MSSGPSSWELLQKQFLQYQQGEATVVRALFAELYLVLKRFFAFKGVPPLEQEDLAQDTLLKIHVNRDQFDSDQSLKTWVFVIAQRN